MNRYFLAFLVLATAFEFQARELTPDEALQRVQGASTRMNAPRRIAASAPKLVYTVKSTLDDRDATAYLFANSGKEKGYLLLSAEDTFEPVIGYSNTATITNPDDMPDNLKWWLSEVGREADYAIRHNAVLKAPASLGPAVEPLLKSKWGQDDPYNLFTPEIDGRHAPTGCVATAMAQIMYYHQWPPKPQGSHSYEWNGQTLSINYDELQFDWDKMNDTYDDNSSQESKEAVATLMKAVGYGVDMNYAPGGSEASSRIVINALNDFFNYNKCVGPLYRDDMYFGKWREAIYSNLTEKMPVFYVGTHYEKPDIFMGHAFVCDGYDGNGYFHFNWGWGGSMDGYFLLTFLDTAEFRFNYGQNIILNLHPENGKNYNDYKFLASSALGIYPYNIHNEDGSIAGNVSYILYNPCGLTNIEVGLGLIARSNNNLNVIPLKWNDRDGVAIADNLLDYLDKSEEYKCQLYWRTNQSDSWTKVWSNMYINNNYEETLKYINERWQYVRDLELIDARLEIDGVIVNSNNVISNADVNVLSFKARNATAEHVFTNFKIVLENQEHFIEYYNNDINKKWWSYEISLEPEQTKEYIIDNVPAPEPGNYKIHILDTGTGRSFYNSGTDSIKVVKYPEMKVGEFVYAKRPNGDMFIKGTATGEPIVGDIYLPAEITVESTKHRVADVNFEGILDRLSECSLTIDTPIEEIRENQFFGLRYLKKVRLPRTVKKISEGAFSCCYGLKEINLPEGLEEIGDSAFYYCSGFTGDLIIPNTVRKIGKAAFAQCYRFTGNLVIPNSVQTIGDYAFSRCSGFTGNLVIPNSVQTIGDYAFSSCSGFNGKLVLGNSVQTIGKAAFTGCRSFTGNLIIPNTVQTIGQYAFYDCSGFTGDLVLPNSVTTIGKAAFIGCRSFNDKWIVPDLKELKYVGGNALWCFNNVICLHEEIPECYATGAFGYATIRVKAGFGGKYRTHANWSGYNGLYEFGDANLSKSLTVTDAVVDANYITGGYTGDPFDFDCGDINMNGEISIADVTGIIRAVAEYNPAGLDASAMRAPRQTAGALEADDFILNEGATEVGVRLHSEHPVVALQADFVCGEGVEIDDIELSPKLTGSHALMLSRFEDEGIVRAIVYSLDNKLIDTDDELLTLHVSGEGTGKIEAERILASTAEASEYSFGFIGGENLSTSGLGEIGSTVRIFGSDGCIRVLNAEGMDIVIYDIAGRKIKAMTAESPEVACPLQSGLYIVTVGNINAKIAL